MFATKTLSSKSSSNEHWMRIEIQTNVKNVNLLTISNSKKNTKRIDTQCQNNDCLHVKLPSN